MSNKNLLQTSGELFRQVQLNRVFSDQKTFVDSVSKENSKIILDNYYKLISNNHGSPVNILEIKNFILENFIFKQERKDNIAANNIDEYINEFINASLLNFTLSKDDHENSNYSSSLINVPNKHLVPGGRFHEFYYWDTYFTALGLADNKLDILMGMLENFAFMIEKYGFIPNGNRTYYLSRSQPPFFSLLLELCISKVAHNKNYKIDYYRYYKLLEIEYSFWMSEYRSINIGNKSFLNRYYDHLNIPRPEGYLHDLELYNTQSEFQQKKFYRKIRAVCESGWDFSTRWYDINNNINILDIAPIDLNCLIYNLETLLAKLCLELNNSKYEYYNNLAITRAKNINSFFWDSKTRFYYDYNLKTKQPSPSVNLASVFPLFLKIASKQQARYVAQKLQLNFLYAGGLTTTVLPSITTNNQWDHPNGWAPLQYIAVVGLINYGYIKLAKDIALRFTRCIEHNFKKHHKILEKYNVVDCSINVNHGEYDIQDGFGWTNGVYIKLKEILSS